MEIDLLREGDPLPTLGVDWQSGYRILVSRSKARPTADLYLFNLDLFNLVDPIPSFRLPLQKGDEEPDRAASGGIE